MGDVVFLRFLKRDFGYMRFLLALPIFLLVSCSQTDRLASPRFRAIDQKGSSESLDRVVINRGQNDAVSIVVERAVTQDPDLLVMEAQGEAEAGDRLLQMHLLRLVSQGRLTEFLGEKALKSDIQFTALGLRQAIRRAVERVKQHPAHYALFEAFARGVNRYIRDLPNRDEELSRAIKRIAKDKNYVLDEWTVTDSVGIGVSLTFLLSSQVENKASTFKSYLFLKVEQLWAGFMDLRAVEKVAILEGRDGKLMSGREAVIEPEIPIDPNLLNSPLFSNVCQGRKGLGFPVPDGCQWMASTGSNSWVVSPEFSGTGEAMLYNDPHLPSSNPQLFYLIKINSKPAGGRFNARGVNVPGIPGILIGHNEDFAWGMTNSMWDPDDLYILDRERTNEGVEKASGFGKDVPLFVNKENFVIRSADGKLETREEIFYETEHYGRVLPISLEKLEKLPDIFNHNKIVSYRWVGHMAGGLEIVAMLDVARAKDFAGFRKALAQFEVGSQNMIYADRKGNIGYVVHGKLPIRKYRDKREPFLPVEAYPFETETPYEWQGLKTEDLFVFNPPSGRIVTANNDPVGSNFEKNYFASEQYRGYRFDPGFRARRITSVLEENRGALDAAKMAKIQTDKVDLMAEKFVNFLREDRERLNLQTAEAKGLLQDLLDWNYEVKRESLVPSRFYLWFAQLESDFFWQKYFKPRGNAIIAELFKLEQKTRDMLTVFLKSSMASTTLYHHLNEKISKEERAKFLSESLEATVKVMQEQGLEQIRWGQAHRLDFVDMLGGALPKLLRFPIERDGSWTTVDMAGFDFSWFLDRINGKLTNEGLSLPVVAGPSVRIGIHLSADGIEGQYSMPGGNRAEFNEEHTIQQLLAWRDGQYEPLPF